MLINSNKESVPTEFMMWGVQSNIEYNARWQSRAENS